MSDKDDASAHGPAVLSAEEVAKLWHKGEKNRAALQWSDLKSLADSHEALRAALAAAQERAKERAEQAHLDAVRIAHLDAKVATLTDERDAARLERDEADDSRESLRLELRASESNRISDARELLRRAEAAEAALATVTQELEGANARIEVMQDIIRSNE